MAVHLSLEVGGKQFKPQLTEMESLYGLRQSRDFMVVFPALDESGKPVLTGDFHFVFSDDIFLTGIHKFRFRLSDIQHVPPLKIDL